MDSNVNEVALAAVQHMDAPMGWPGAMACAALCLSVAYVFGQALKNL